MGLPVATALAVAASFWGTHGYPDAQYAQPGWDWDMATACPALIASAGCAVPGSNVIHLNRAIWDRSARWLKCTIVTHEFGHAVLRFHHTPGTLMDGTAAAYRFAPGGCRALGTRR